MRAYVIESGVRIDPFRDLARDLPIAGVALSTWQTDLFTRFGIERISVQRVDEIPSDEPRLVTYDNVFFTRRILKSFLARWRAGRGGVPSRVALPLDSLFVTSFSTLQELDRDGAWALYDLWALPRGVSFRRDSAFTPLPVVFREKVLEMPVARNVTGVDTWRHPITSSVCLHIRHWIHVLQANRLSIQIRWVDEVLRHPIWAAWVMGRALVPRRGRLLWRILERGNRIGRHVDIHPTARIEASFIGDGARIGPNALVRGSIIGKSTTLEECVNVAFSVIGDGGFVSKNSIVNSCAAMDGADLCMKGMQMCLVGRKAALTARANPMDVIPGRRLRVMDRGELKEIDLPVLGACFGHESFIGADLFIAPGRAIPNGVWIGPQPERVLSTIPDDLEAGHLYTVRGGRLVDP